VFKIFFNHLLVVVDVNMRQDIAKPLKGLALKVSTGRACAVTGRLMLVVARRLLSESADGIAARKTAGAACSHDEHALQ
jgi:hypothetical protein